MKKLLNKGLAAVLSLALVFTSADFMPKKVSGEVTKLEPYVVSDETTLNALQNYIDTNLVDNTSLDVIVTNNITMSGDFAGINVSKRNDCKIQVYGKGGATYTISNLKQAKSANKSDKTPIGGLFNKVEGVDVEIYCVNLEVDLSVSFGNFYSEGDYDKYIGGYIGYAKNCNVSIHDVKVSGNINANYNNNIGGVIGYYEGYNNTLKVTNSQTIVAINGFKKLGGVVGAAYGNDMSLNFCTNMGSISGIGDIGGIVGYISNGKVNDSMNIASITNNINVVSTSISNIGGDIGTSYAESTNIVNMGTISINAESAEAYYIGGNIGYNCGKVYDAINGGKITIVAKKASCIAGNIGYNVSGSNTVTELTNNGDIDAGDNSTNIGGNVGSNQSGTINDITNTGDVEGTENIGGNVGGVSGGTVSDAENSGTINGESNVGGNIGQANSGTTSEELVNSGSVNGSDNVGGNVGENNGTNSGDINSGSVNGSTDVGGNVGTNTGTVNGAQNEGDVNGDSNANGNVGSDSGTTTNTKDLSEAKTDSDTGNTQIISPSDETNTYTDPKNITFTVNPQGAGAIYDQYISKEKLSVLAKPVEGYKFTTWEITGAKILSGKATDTKVTVEPKSGAEIVAKFTKVESAESIVDSETPTVKYESGLVISVDPTSAGSIMQYVSVEGELVLGAIPNSGYEFDKWKIGGSVTLANGFSYTDTTCDFKFTENEKNSITAVFKKSTAAPINTPISGPGAGTTISNANFNFKVTKAGKTNNGATGEVLVKSLRKTSLKKITIGATVTINGVKYNITAIGAKAFKGNKKITKVTIGKNVKTIGKNAFNGCKKLKNVKINSKKITKIGKKAFYRKGGKKVTFKVPSSKKAAYKKLLKKAKTNKYKVK